MRGLLCAAGLAVVLVAGTAAADESATGLQSDEWICGDLIKLPKDKVATILEQAEGVGRRTAGGASSFLVLDFPEIFGEQDSDPMLWGGTIFAVQSQLGWRVQAIEAGGGIEAVKRTADDRHILVISMFGRGGPGGSYTIVSTNDGFSSFFCGTVDFPDGLNRPNWRNEFLAFRDINGEPGGRLVLTGSVDREIRTGEYVTEHYSYESADGGRNWGRPILLGAEPGKLAGAFQAVDDADVAALKGELLEAMK